MPRCRCVRYGPPPGHVPTRWEKSRVQFVATCNPGGLQVEIARTMRIQYDWGADRSGLRFNNACCKFWCTTIMVESASTGMGFADSLHLPLSSIPRGTPSMQPCYLEGSPNRRTMMFRRIGYCFVACLLLGRRTRVWVSHLCPRTGHMTEGNAHYAQSRSMHKRTRETLRRRYLQGGCTAYTIISSNVSKEQV
jgi:hypothetical protein